MRSFKLFAHNQLLRAQLLCKAATNAVRLGGGLRPTLSKAWRVLQVEGLTGVRKRLAYASVHNQSRKDYQTWVELYDAISDEDRRVMKSIAESWRTRPLISIVMPTFNSPERLLREAIESVLAQTYDNWELCIADDASAEPHVGSVLEAYRRLDSRIKIVYRKENGHISQASNSALELATGEWIALLDHDDRLAEHALFCVAAAINSNPTARLFYSDRDKIDLNGTRHDPYFKCDWNPMLFLSHNLITHLSVYHARTVRKIGGFRTGVEGAQDYDLALRFVECVSAEKIVHIPHVLYHWRVLPGSTAKAADEKPYAMLAGERALNEHFARTRRAAKANLVGFGYRIDFELPNPEPLVSIIIPTRNALELTRSCIDSVRTLTTYQNYEIIIIDNGSDDPAALAYFELISGRRYARVIRDDRQFNYSALNNAAVEAASGTVIALLNNDIEVISPDWLTRMVALAMQPDVGAVGAKLLYPNDTIQHGGVVLGLGGIAAHAHAQFPRNSPGYVARAALAQNFSAVTAACLVVQKSHYLKVGGLNERDLTVAYNDIDFCLKLRRLGLRNVWTPFAELYHHESATRGYETTREKQARFEKEKAYMLAAWPQEIASDPAYSPNLTRETADFALAFPPRMPHPWHTPVQISCRAGV